MNPIHSRTFVNRWNCFELRISQVSPNFNWDIRKTFSHMHNRWSVEGPQHKSPLTSNGVTLASTAEVICGVFDSVMLMSFNDRKNTTSHGVNKSSPRPSLPALPVRPSRWMYCSRPAGVPTCQKWHSGFLEKLACWIGLHIDHYPNTNTPALHHTAVSSEVWNMTTK